MQLNIRIIINNLERRVRAAVTILIFVRLTKVVTFRPRKELNQRKKLGFHSNYIYID